MCGVTGLRAHGVDSSLFLAALPAMTDALAHRGPDSQRTWVDEGAGVGFGHARLAIRDLSTTGAQPMVSADGRWVIAYNGEVYSQVELSRALVLAGRQLRGTSDTEAILEHIATFGLDASLPLLIGMFAFALWDREDDTLFLVRDRLGIKPLYWTTHHGAVAFASELKAFSALPEWRPVINRGALATYLRFNYVPSPDSIYAGVHKVPPATVMRFANDGTVSHHQYWELLEIACEGVRARTLAASVPEVGDVERLLTDAVRRRLVSDVPVGSLLSGGIDSSLVTALMAEESPARIRTYSIGFPVAEFDEAPLARVIARRLGTDHTELYVEPHHALDLVRSLPKIYDEPFGDSSQLPSIIVSELTRQHVTVALTGDGGDEVFGGYNRYLVGPSLGRSVRSLPMPLRRGLASLAGSTPAGVVDALMRLLPPHLRRPQASTKIRELAGFLEGRDANGFYRGLVTHWPDPNAVVIGGSEISGLVDNAEIVAAFPDDLDRMQLLDLLTYLPDDILVKMDRASMSVGLEARVPLLDHRLVEMSWRLPQDMKIRDGQSKWVLREILASRVPRHMWERPKMGFGVPIDAWLRGPLRSWAEDLLSEERLRTQGLLNPSLIRKRWADHQRGENWAYPLWDVLMLQAWLDEWNPSLG